MSTQLLKAANRTPSLTALGPPKILKIHLYDYKSKAPKERVGSAINQYQKQEAEKGDSRFVKRP